MSTERKAGLGFAGDPLVRFVARHFEMYLTGCTSADAADVLGIALADAERRLRQAAAAGAIVARDAGLSLRYEPTTPFEK